MRIRPRSRRSSCLPATLTVALVALSGCGDATQTATTARAAAPRTAVGAGVSVVVPRGWHLLRPPISSLAFPAERLLLTSYPTTSGGNCGPDRAARDLPADGALIYLFEYRPRTGDPWAGLRRRDFPRRPSHFALRRRDLGTSACIGVPSRLISFRTADRPFQLHVALGERAGADRRAQVRRILDSLRFSALPAPLPDRYAGWRELIDETGDTIRTPPRWPAAVTTSPRRYSRPRTLFFASNRRLPGLAPAAARSARRARRLPRAVPTRALDALADDGVLLWVREAAKGAPSDAFPRLPRRAWPRDDDFRPLNDGPARKRPRLHWERAGGQAQGHRFTVWVISAPGASARDRALARKAAAALALATGKFRDAPCRRACRTG